MTTKRCYTCLGKKYAFLMGRDSVTTVDLGGRKIKCPACMGSGRLDITDLDNNKETIEEHGCDSRIEEEKPKKRGRRKKAIEESGERT